MDHQQQIKDIEEKEDEEYEYNKNNKEDICYDQIDYDEYIDQEELDRILEDTERNPNFHQDKDKKNYDYSEKEILIRI